jgi:phosphonoacetate hydrolase
MVAAGPGFRRGARVEAPSGNIDLTPTILRLLGLPVPESLEGRVLSEAFADGGDPAPEAVLRRYRTSAPGGKKSEIQEIGAGGASYVQWIRGEAAP